MSGAAPANTEGNGKVWVKFYTKLGGVKEPKRKEAEYDGEMTITALHHELIMKQGVLDAPTLPSGRRQHVHLFLTSDQVTGESFVPTPDQTLENLASLYAKTDDSGRKVLGITLCLKIYMG